MYRKKKAYNMMKERYNINKLTRRFQEQKTYKVIWKLVEERPGKHWEEINVQTEMKAIRCRKPRNVSFENTKSENLAKLSKNW